jgi:hypothetical protein
MSAEGASEAEMRVIKATVVVLLNALKAIAQGAPDPQQIASEALSRASVMAQEL